MAQPPNRRKLLLFAVFFVNLLSLACQVIWVRKLSFLFGSTAAVFSTVLSVFLLGLALGALLGGRAIDRAARPWRLLGGIEVLLGLYCALSLPIFDLGRSVFLTAFPNDLSPFATALAKLLVVLVTMITPTFAIGAIFPIAVQMYSRRGDSLGGGISLIYALDTLGAATGALLAGFLLVPQLGLSWSTMLLGAVAVGLGIATFRVDSGPRAPVPPVPPAPSPGPAAEGAGPAVRDTGKRKKGKPGKQAAAAPEPPVPVASWSPGRTRLVLGIFFFSGAAALLLETGWNRLFYVLNGTSVYSMSVLLAGFLSGIGLGSLAMRRRIDRIRDPLAAVAVLYAATALGGVLVFRSSGLFARFYLAIFQATGSYYAFQLQVCLLIFVLVLLATLPMGANFPLVAKIVARVPERRGFSVGQVFFWNTLGAVLGAFLGEFVALPAWGFGGLLLLVLALYGLGAAAFLALSPARWRTRSAAVSAALLAVALVLSPLVLDLAMPFHAVYYHGLRDRTWSQYSSTVRRMRLVDEQQGFYGQVVVAELGENLLLKHNGKTDASTGRDNFAQLLMGHLPLFLHPRPATVLNIGLGGGVTLRAINRHADVERITNVEIDPLVVDAARRHFAEFNERALEDPRVEVVTNDGRNYVDGTDRTFDVIISEPPNIWVAGVSGLFTREFYESARTRLAPGGLLCQWVPLHELEREDMGLALKTVTSVFPYASVWTNGIDGVIVASLTPFDFDPARVAAKLADPKIRRDFTDAGLAPDEATTFLDAPFLNREAVPGFIGEIDFVNRDDRPLLEFRTARNLFYFNKRPRR